MRSPHPHADILGIDALRHRPQPTHCSIDERLAVIDKLSPREAWLTHMNHEVSHAEVDATLDGWGITTPSSLPLMTARTMYARSFYPRMVEIIQLNGSSSLMALPSEADFDTELRPDLDRYLATDTSSALDRTKLFHLAWDISCSAFGSRQTHYERHFAGDPLRSAIIMANIYDRKPAEQLVHEFLER